MQLQPTDDQQAFRGVAARFARDKLAPSYQKRAAGHTFDRDLIREMGALGLIAPDLPEEFGGLGLDSVTAGLVVEEIAYADFNASYIQLLGSLMGGMVAKHASADIAAEWVPKVISGDAVIGLGLTEPRGGSDAATVADCGVV